MTEMFRVAQLSDTHFLEPDAGPEGGFAYDTSAAFDAALAHLRARDTAPDLVVVTGDIADHGRPEQYEIALDAFVQLPGRVHLCPGNHDFDAPLRAEAARYDVHLPRVTTHGPWAFVYVDSNAGGMIDDGAGGRVDPPGEQRLHSHGSLGADESAWLRDTLRDLDAEHVFVWLHHPPAPDVALSYDEGYAREWSALVDALEDVRGFGAGHTHVPVTYRFADRPVFVAPALKNNFDLDASTFLPPGYRSYEFGDDGSIASEVHLLDDDRWPRRPMGRAVRSLFAGEITFVELDAIVARKRAEADAGGR